MIENFNWQIFMSGVFSGIAGTFLLGTLYIFYITDKEEKEKELIEKIVEKVKEII